MNKKVTLNQKLDVSRLTGLIGLLAIVLVAAFFISASTLGVRACLKSHSRVQSSDHQTNHCRINHRFRRFA